MSPRTLGEQLISEVPLLRVDQQLGTAVPTIVDADVPALPVVDADNRFAGILGEREFIAAISPGYLGDLHYAGFVTGAADDWLEKRSSCLGDPVSKHMNTEHIDVGPDWSDAQLAETFLHHRVLIIPVVDSGQVRGIVTRSAFFRALVERVADSA